MVDQDTPLDEDEEPPPLEVRTARGNPLLSICSACPFLWHETFRSVEASYAVLAGGLRGCFSALKVCSVAGLPNYPCGLCLDLNRRLHVRRSGVRARGKLSLSEARHCGLPPATRASARWQEAYG